MDATTDFFAKGEATADAPNALPSSPANLAILEFFFPGFGIISGGLQRYLGIDLNLYIPSVILLGGAMFAWQYFSDYVWGMIETYLMSSVEILTDDEIYVSRLLSPQSGRLME